MLLLTLLLASTEPVQTVECRVIQYCEEGADSVCKGAYKVVQLRGPYKDGRFELDFICLRRA